tara:strand:- start:5835 stop:6032 length:198 start_codon:yes stop_codon:yes gene_type:complete
MDRNTIDHIILSLAILAFIFVIATVSIVGIQAENYIEYATEQIDTMWSELEIVRVQTSEIYSYCK